MTGIPISKFWPILHRWYSFLIQVSQKIVLLFFSRLLVCLPEKHWVEHRFLIQVSKKILFSYLFSREYVFFYQIKIRKKWKRDPVLERMGIRPDTLSSYAYSINGYPVLKSVSSLRKIGKVSPPDTHFRKACHLIPIPQKHILSIFLARFLKTGILVTCLRVGIFGHHP